MKRMAIILAAILCSGWLPSAAAQTSPMIKKHATIRSGLGGSYCSLEDDGKKYPVREITDASLFVTREDVPMTFYTEGKKDGPCPGIAVVNASETMRIRYLDQQLTLQFLDSKIDVDVAPFPSASQVHYLTGSKGHFDYFVFLIDIPQGLDEIYKYYRVTIFDNMNPTCKNTEPKPSTFFAWSNDKPATMCTDVDVARQTQGGGGYEPPHK